MQATKQDKITVRVNGQAVSVRPGASVAVAILLAGVPFRSSASGDPRSAFCGMGICEECRAMVDGLRVRTCQHPVADGMEITAA